MYEGIKKDDMMGGGWGDYSREVIILNNPIQGGQF